MFKNFFSKNAEKTTGVSAGSGQAVADHANSPYNILGNPIAWITPQYAASVLDDADTGRYTMAQWTLHYAMQMDADLLCVGERIDRAIQTLPWSIKPIAGADPALAQAQVDYLKSEYERIDRLEGTLRFLASYRIAGYSHSFISTGDDGQIVLTPMEQYFWVRDGMFGAWGYNPRCYRTGFTPDMAVDPSQCLIVESTRPLLRFAVLKWLKSSFSSRWWDKYNEIVSKQGTVLVAPERVGDIQEFNSAALSIAEGNSGVIAHGTEVNMPNNQRGNPPYKERLEYLREELVLAVTGGMLTSLAAPTGMGSNVASVQQDVWRVIASGMGLDIAEEFRRKIDKPLLKKQFPNQPVMAYFNLGEPLAAPTTEVKPV